jgi:hypothetical protein
MADSEPNFLRTTQAHFDFVEAMPKTVPLRIMPRRAPRIALARDTVDEPGDDNADGLLTPPSRRPGGLAAASAPAPEAAAGDGRPRLRVIRGQKVSVEYPLYDGANYLGRRDERPIDIDLEAQEPPDRIWTSRKHAVIYLVDGRLELEDLNSLNGTFVNRTRVPPDQRRPLHAGDVVQVGTIQLRVMA